MTLDEAIVHAREVASRKFDDRVHCIRCAEEHEQLVKWLEELNVYRTIGTQDECRTAVDKQKAKKIVRVKLRQSEWGSEYRCPVCESDLIKTVFFNEDGTEPDEKISWCSGCGQKLYWSEEIDYYESYYAKNNGWITSSELFPCESGYYLVTYHEWSNGDYLPKFDDTYVRRLHYQRSEHFTGWNYPHCIDERAEMDTNREVIAWRKLPTPYQPK